MNAIASLKSRAQNRLEGFALTALFQGLPTFASAAMLLKLAGRHEIVDDPGGAAIFVTLAAIFYALLVPWLTPKFPKFFKAQYEPLFFDARLSFADKIAQWRAQPAASLQLVALVLMLSLEAVAVVSMR